jgi:hypothetical protein
MIIIKKFKATPPPPPPPPPHVQPNQQEKSLKRKEYEINRTFKNIWVAKLPWAKFVIGSDGKIS